MRISLDCAQADWNEVVEILALGGLAHRAPEVHRRAFENSHTAVFVYLDNRLAGFGRAISDAAYQAAVYDVAVRPEYRSRGIGTAIIRAMLDRLPHCNFILYAAPGREEFYRKIGFSRMLTGMALFRQADRMRAKGFTD